jgi:hypothetical protein
MRAFLSVLVAGLFVMGFFGANNTRSIPRASFPPVTVLVDPSKPAVVSGKQRLAAAAEAVSAGSTVVKVEFRVTSSAVVDRSVARAGKSFLGVWVAFWDTKDVPNGSYELRSVVYDSGGRVGKSDAVKVRVAN